MDVTLEESREVEALLTVQEVARFKGIDQRDFGPSSTATAREARSFFICTSTSWAV